MKKKLFMIGMAAIFTLAATAQQRHLMVVHTSDTHSCVEPISKNFSDTAQADKGGFMRRATLLNQLRKEHPDLLLFDCGDFSQGSVYYNLYHGEVEVKLMNSMKYDACTIGNHEFDYGLENLSRLISMADFPFVCCNYDFTGTPCEHLVKPYIIIERSGARVGVFGVCPQPDGLITKSNYEPMKYIEPALAAQSVIDLLRNKEHCDVVICLSHLGWSKGKGYDQDFIAHTTGIDILLGGHTHTYFEHPEQVSDKTGHKVMVDHMGKNARFIGTMEVTLEP
ncbi:MAG: bifunctional metallophosphatase/5'-nucleotidase [Bacteroidaceae bacterium]